MNALVKHPQWNLPTILNRDEFLTSFDRLFDELVSRSFPEFTKELGVGFFERGSYPKVDVIDFADHVEITAEIPGLKKDEVSVEIRENILILKGEKRKDVSKEDPKYLVRELKRSSFVRSFALGENLDAGSVEAKFEDGLLVIRLNKIKVTKPEVRKIDIK